MSSRKGHGESSGAQARLANAIIGLLIAAELAMIVALTLIITLSGLSSSKVIAPWRLPSEAGMEDVFLRSASDVV